MNVEDSYEGALRRMQRLEMAGIVAMQSAPSDGIEQAAIESNADRMQELEELATLACEDNERLKGELAIAQRDVDDARRTLDDARGAMAQAYQELDGAHRQIEQLRGQVSSLQQQLVASTQQPFANVPQQTFAPSPFAPSPFATDPSLDEDYGYPPKSSGRGALYFILVVLVGGVVAALFVTRPWERPHVVPIPVEQPAPQPPPVVTAPSAPKVEATVPKVAPAPAPMIPKIAATIPKAAPVAAHEPRAAKTRAEHKHAKHHAAKKHASAKSKEAAVADSDDPLGGTGL